MADAGGTARGSIRRLYPHAALTRLPADAPPRIACLTLDYECEYGPRTDEFRLLDRDDDLGRLRALVERRKVPLSLFVATGLLDRYPKALPVARHLGDDWHGHGHTHRRDADPAAEITACAEAFRRHFGRPPLGYRAPVGMLHADDVPLLDGAGFSFSASVMPSYRPGRYNHLGQPTTPLRYANGLLELPFGVVNGLRLPVAVSYFKLVGPSLGLGLLRTLGAPRVLIVPFHLHDVLVDDHALASLPAAVRAAFSVRRQAGLAVLDALLGHLQATGYTFLRMTDAFELCSRGAYESP